MQLLPEDDIILQGLIKGQPIKKKHSHPPSPSLRISPTLPPLPHYFHLFSVTTFSFLPPSSLFRSSFFRYLIHPFSPSIYISSHPSLHTLQFISSVGSVAANVKAFYCDCCNECNCRCDCNQ